MCHGVANAGVGPSPLSLLSCTKNRSCDVALSSTGLSNHSKRLSRHSAKDEVKTELICEAL